MQKMQYFQMFVIDPRHRRRPLTNGGPLSFSGDFRRPPLDKLPSGCTCTGPLVDGVLSPINASQKHLPMTSPMDEFWSPAITRAQVWGPRLVQKNGGTGQCGTGEDCKFQVDVMGYEHEEEEPRRLHSDAQEQERFSSSSYRVMRNGNLASVALARARGNWSRPMQPDFDRLPVPSRNSKGGPGRYKKESQQAQEARSGCGVVIYPADQPQRA
ncbi:uncharacterized protein B0I36DRAFT_348754 [Microdochium trichocladiopsis]|uniref:Uncharacterized protein n=1 Tax=Microdochium trichocladiopsis TaxID=1682393 RepID=A0A9P8YCM4_9PEZI|nr:uncharacterized protein B0I36DRAFT_348754 [Microdochium trichocladiopsis]KAH7033742.1 hypothetical protein B0I36DRAFT_348754 [Microdochium trichocladiopsis]